MRIVRAGDIYRDSFTTQSGSGESANADSLPTAAAYRNGVLDGAVTVTVVNVTAGAYTLSFTVPVGYAAGDTVQALVTTLIGALPVKGWSSPVTVSGFPATALPNAAAKAAGGLYVRGTGVGEIAQDVNGTVNVNMTHLANAIQTAGDLYPAIQGIGTATGAAVNTDVAADNSAGGIAGVTSGTVKVGTPAGTFANTVALNGNYHTITGTATALDWVYQFNTGGGTTAVGMVWTGYAQSANDIVTIYVWNHIGAAWEEMGTIVGNAGTVNIVKNLALFARHRGTSTAERGKVYVRFACTAMTNPLLATDQVYVTYAVTSRTAGYANGAIWIDTVNGTPGTEPFVDGTADHPVNSLADALTLSASTLINRFYVANGSALTLTASFTGKTVEGAGYTLNLNGQNISGSFFKFSSGVSGVGTAAGARPAFQDCRIGTVTLPPCLLYNVVMEGIFTVGAAGDYVIINGNDATASTLYPVFDFNNTIGPTTLLSHDWHGGIEFRNVLAGDFLALDGMGRVVFDATCTGGERRVRGTFDVEDFSTGMVVAEDANMTLPAFFSKNTGKTYASAVNGSVVKEIAGHVTLADGVPHGGTPGASTATLAMQRVYVNDPTATAAVRVESSGTGIGLQLNAGTAVRASGTLAGVVISGDDGPGLSVIGVDAPGLLIQGTVNAAPSVAGLYITGSVGAAAVEFIGSDNGPGLLIQGGPFADAVNLLGGDGDGDPYTPGSGLVIASGDNGTGTPAVRILAVDADAVTVEATSGGAGGGHAVRLMAGGADKYGFDGTLSPQTMTSFFDTDSGFDYGDAVAGSVVKEIADNAGGGGAGGSAWDEMRDDHVLPGSFGEYANARLADYVVHGGVHSSLELESVRITLNSSAAAVTLLAGVGRAVDIQGSVAVAQMGSDDAVSLSSATGFGLSVSGNGAAFFASMTSQPALTLYSDTGDGLLLTAPSGSGIHLTSYNGITINASAAAMTMTTQGATAVEIIPTDGHGIAITPQMTVASSALAGVAIFGAGTAPAVMLGNGAQGAEGLLIMAGTESDTGDADGVKVVGAGNGSAARLGDGTQGGEGLRITAGPGGPGGDSHGVAILGAGAGVGMAVSGGPGGVGMGISGTGDHCPGVKISGGTNAPALELESPFGGGGTGLSIAGDTGVLISGYVAYGVVMIVPDGVGVYVTAGLDAVRLESTGEHDLALAGSGDIWDVPNDRLISVTGGGGSGGGLDAAGVRAAIGMALPNLDAQLAGISTGIINISAATGAENLATKVADVLSVVTGTTVSGTLSNTETDDNVYLITAPVTPAVGGFGLRQRFTFNLGTDRIPVKLHLRGWWNGTGEANIFALHGQSGTYDQLTNSGTSLASRNNEQIYSVPLPRDYADDSGGSFNVITIELRAASTTAANRLRVDQILIAHVDEDSPATFTAPTLEDIWNYPSRTLSTPNSEPSVPPSAAEIAAATWTRVLNESYAANGAAFTPEQAMFMLWSALSEFIISGNAITCKKLDRSTVSMTFTLDDADEPLARTRAS